MSIAESLLPEFDNETASTRRVLACIPDDKGDWKPHPKSFSLGLLGLHIANLLQWAVMTMKQSELDLNPPDGAKWPAQEFQSTAALLQTFDERMVEARAAIAAASDADMMAPWTLKNAGAAIFTMPKVAVLRSFVFNHTIHHRGQLTVYLRLLDVPLPSVYGPTADAPN